jgi:hypothetical protein
LTEHSAAEILLNVRKTLQQLLPGDHEELLRRAFRAWFSRESAEDQLRGFSAVEEHDGHWYVVLRGGRGNIGAPMAVYRVMNDGVLRRLRRWPSSIEEMAST